MAEHEENADTAANGATLRRCRLTRKKERLNTNLLDAIISSDMAAVNKLLDEGACPMARCRTLKTSTVHLAAFCGLSDILSHLVNEGADLALRDENGAQAAHLAAWAGHTHILNLIVSIVPPLINSPVMPGQTTDLQDDLDSWDHDHQHISQMMPAFDFGSTPLHIACKLNNVETVNYLLNEGADVHMKDCKGLTPLDVAGTSKPWNHLMNEKNETGVTVNKSNDNNLKCSSPDEVDNTADDKEPHEDNNLDTNEDDQSTVRRPSKSMYDIVTALFESGARMQDEEDVCFLEGLGWNIPITALHTAVTKGDTELIDYLLSKGANLMTKDERDETPLHLAVRLKLLESLKVMLSWATLDIIDTKDGRGRTALHLAVSQEWPGGIGLLLEAGADVTLTTNDNETVLHITATKGNEILLEEFLSMPDCLEVIDAVDNNQYTALFRAVERPSLECAKMLIKQGADLSIKLPGNQSVLHVAVDVKSIEMLKVIGEHKAVVNRNVNSLCDRKDGKMSPLHIASENGSVECAQFLIESGADIFLRMTDEYGSTAAHLAACEGHCDIMVALIAHNPDCLDVPDVQGWYPLQVAARYGHGHCVVLMLQHGANISVNIPDNAVTKSALDLIVEYVPKGIDKLERLFDSYIGLESCAVKDPSCLVTMKYTLFVGKKQEDSKDDKQLTFFNTLLNSNNEQLKETLLLHPLTESFLYFKWMSMRNFFITLMLLYVVYTVCLTVFALNTYVSYIPTYSVLFRTLSIVLLLPIIISECLQAGTLQRYYFVDDESWLRWSMVMSGGLACLSHSETILSRYLASLAVLLSWIELLFLFARFPAWGLHVLMFEKVASNVFQVLSRFVFLIFGFLFAFMIHFSGTPPFGNFWESLCKVFIMIVELDYSASFSDAEENMRTMPPSWYSLFGRLLYVTFVVLVAMVMMNLIVGLCVSDVALLEVQGRTQRLAKQTAFLSFLEMSMYNKCLLGWLPSLLQEVVRDCRAVPASMTIFPNDPRCPLPLPLRRRLMKRVKALLPSKFKGLSVDLKLQHIDSSIDSLRNEIIDLQKSVLNINSSLTILAQNESKNKIDLIK